MVYFCAMNGQFKIVILIVFLLSGSLICHAQQTSKENGTKSVFLTPMCVYEGDTIPYVKLPTVYIFKPLKFKNRREMAKYYKLIRDVKKVLPISKEINRAIIETYEILANHTYRKRTAKASESCGKRAEGTVHSPNEKALASLKENC